MLLSTRKPPSGPWPHLPIFFGCLTRRTAAVLVSGGDQQWRAARGTEHLVHGGAGPVAGPSGNGAPLLSSSPRLWVRFLGSLPGCKVPEDEMPSPSLPLVAPHVLVRMCPRTVCPGEPRPHFTSSFVCLVSLLFCLVFSLGRGTGAFWGVSFATLHREAGGF